MGRLLEYSGHGQCEWSQAVELGQTYLKGQLEQMFQCGEMANFVGSVQVVQLHPARLLQVGLSQCCRDFLYSLLVLGSAFHFQDDGPYCLEV